MPMPRQHQPDDSAPVRLLRYGRVKEALAKIQAGSDPNEVDEDFHTPILYAAVQGSWAAFEALAGRGAVLTWRGRDGESLFDYAFAAYRTVFASINALALFQSALAKGSNEAKLYALAAIRHLDKKSFDAAAKALLAANPEVSTMSGCIVNHEKAEAVVKRIAGGLSTWNP